MKPKPTLIALFALAIAAGCATTTNLGNLRITEDALARITEGETTKAEVGAILGKPESVIKMDGTGLAAFMPYETWTYSNMTLASSGFFSLDPGQTAISIVQIGFDKAGVVRTKTFTGTAVGAGEFGFSQSNQSAGWPPTNSPPKAGKHH